MSDLVTPAEFARMEGVNKSTVYRWRKDGRLVTSGRRVKVEESRQRLDQTRGGRDDVAERHARRRRGEEAVAPRSETRADAQARKESAAADLLEIELAEKRGALVSREEVEHAMAYIGAAVRAALDNFPDQQAPILAPVADLDECHALLAEACRGVQGVLAEETDRQKSRVLKGAAR